MKPLNHGTPYQERIEMPMIFDLLMFVIGSLIGTVLVNVILYINRRFRMKRREEERKQFIKERDKWL